MNRSLAALVAVATLAAPAAALAEPANGAGLKFMGTTTKGGLFLADGPGKRTGSTVEFWTLTAFTTPADAAGVPVVAVWLAQKIDCTAKTMTAGESVILNDRLVVVHRQPSEAQAPRPIIAGTPGERLRAHYCDGASLDGLVSTPAAGVAAAIRLSKPPGAAPAPAR